MTHLESDRPRIDGAVDRRFNSDAVADTLRRLKFRYLPLTPGSSFRGVHDSVVNYLGNHDPQLILCLHEQVAISVAHGYSKATREACPVLMHDLVGLMNGSMAIYNAFCDDAPLVILGGGGPTDRGSVPRPIDAIHSAETQAELVRNFVKWTDEPVSVAAATQGVYRAHQLAMSAPTGPTYVTLDCKAMEEELSTDFVAPDPSEFASAPPLAADRGAADQAVALLRDARLPVVVVGGHAAEDPQVTPLLIALLETVGAAYVEAAGFESASALPSVHPLNAMGDDELLAEADVVLFIDVRDAVWCLGPARAGVAGGSTGARQLIEVSTGDLRIKSWSNAFAGLYRRDVRLVADPIRGLEVLLEAAHDLQGSPAVQARKEMIQARVTQTRERLQAAIDLHWDDAQISSARFIGELWEAVREVDWLLVCGQYPRHGRIWHEGIWEFTTAGQFLSAGGGGGLGYGPGAAVGAALAARDRGQIAVSIVGDGDFIMANSALWTAVHYQLPLLMVVNDNRTFGNDEEHQARVAEFRGRPAANAGIGVRFDEPSIDLATLARSFGCHAEGPVSDPNELKDAFSRAVEAVKQGKVAVVHIVTSLQPA